MRLFATILLASVALGQGAESAAGRWEGTAQIPGQELKLVVDLSDEDGKGWTGSIIVPGIGVKGAQLVGPNANSTSARSSTPLVMNGVVYFGSTDGNLYAID